MLRLQATTQVSAKMNLNPIALRHRSVLAVHLCSCFLEALSDTFDARVKKWRILLAPAFTFERLFESSY